MDTQAEELEPTEPEATAERIARSLVFRALVRERSRFAWTLSVATLAIYFGFILLVAFAPDLLGRSIGGGTTTLGIPLGIGVILAGILLTGIYVHRANDRFDALTRQIHQDAGL